MMEKRKIQAETIIEQIRRFAESKDLIVYLVGGYLRDKLLRRKSKDIDIVMESDALKFAREFSRKHGYLSPVFYGRFGTAMLEIAGFKLEFATCRQESYPEDSRKPQVESATIYQDLARRDFTINAIASNLLTGEMLDPFCGRQDLKRKIIKTPVDPDRTFFDDPLRILRGIRFASRFKFLIAGETKEAMKRNVYRLDIVSQERVAEEIIRMLEASQPSRAFYLLDEIGVLPKVLPEVAALKEQKADHPCKELFTHTLKTLDNISLHTRDVHLKLAMLLHDIGKPRTFRVTEKKVSFHRHEFVGERMGYRVCQRLKIGSAETQRIGRLIRFHLWPHLLAKEGPTDKGLRRFIREVGKDRRDLFRLARADLTSQNLIRVERALARINHLEHRIGEINRKDRISSFRLAVDGFVIMEHLGLSTGRAVGKVKKYLENLVLEGKVKNTRRALKKLLSGRKDAILRQVGDVIG